MGLRFSVHPLFLAFGVYYALIGKVFLFLTVTVCAVLHELGHSFSAQRAGYKLNRITLMPFGAVIDGADNDIKPLDEIKIALAGPFINLAVGVFFVALWWVFPETYPYTDIAVNTCFSLALVNLIPAYPLDGGRVLYALIRTKASSNLARKICTCVGFIFCALLFALFVASAFTQINLSLLFFTLFILFGLFGRKNHGRYVKMFSSFPVEKTRRGMPCKKFAIDEGATLKRLVSLMDEDCFNEVVILSNGNPKATLTQTQVADILKKYPICSTFSQIDLGFGDF